jgi:hypothetical protein
LRKDPAERSSRAAYQVRRAEHFLGPAYRAGRHRAKAGTSHIVALAGRWIARPFRIGGRRGRREVLAGRNPTLLFLLSGRFLLR